MDRCLHPVLNKATGEEFFLPSEIFSGLCFPRLSLSDRPLVGLPALQNFLEEQGDRMEFLLS